MRLRSPSFKTSKRLMRVALALSLSATVVLILGCTQPKPDHSPPDWLRHHAMPQTNSSADLNAQINAITHDLATPVLSDEALPPEEVAGVAIEALKSGLIPEACLLIAASDYRFHQAAQRAAMRQKATRQDARYLALTPPPREVAERLMAREVEVYDTRRLIDNLDDCADLLYNRRSQESQISRIAARVLSSKSNILDDVLADVRATQEAPSQTAPEVTIHHPELAAALLARLVDDAQTTETDPRAWELLAALPFADFQIAALEQVQTYAEPRLLRTLLRHTLRLPGFAERIRALLNSPSATTRSNVAILAGLAPDLTSAGSLEAALQQEIDPLARLSLTFALAAKGDHDAFLSIFCAAIAVCSVSGDEQDHAMSLLHWLPETVKQSLAPDDLFLLLDSARGRYIAFAGALAIIQQMAPSIGADGPTVAFIMKRLKLIDDSVLVERLSSALAAIPQIDHVSVMAAMDRVTDSKQRVALLKRLASIVEPGDVAQLAVWWSYFADTDTRLEIVDVTARIPGESATAALLTFFDDPHGGETTRYRAAQRLALRPDAPRKQLAERVVRYPNDYTLPVLLLCGDERGPELLTAAFDSPDPAQRFLAVTTAAELGLDNVEPQLWVQAAYIDRRTYPNDVILRHAALHALLGLVIERGADASR